MLCITNPAELILSGSWTTDKQKYFSVRIKRCKDPDDGTKLCKDDDEIDELINNTAVIGVFNTQTYKPEQYGKQTIKNEAQMDYLPL